MRNDGNLAFFKQVDLFVDGEKLLLQDVQTQLYDSEFALGNAFFGSKEFEKNGFDFGRFEVLVEILQLIHVVYVIATWEKDVWVFANC